jgi:hypothetical protein
MFTVEEPYGFTQFQAWIIALTLGIVIHRRRQSSENYIQY